MSSLNYMNYSELKCFAKVQGFCLFMASFLLIITHPYIYSQVHMGTQNLFAVLFVIFFVVFFINLFYSQQLKPYFTKLIIAIYSIISLLMLAVFLA